MTNAFPLLTLLLAGAALAAGPKSALVDATFIDGAQVVTGSADLGQFPASVATVAGTAGGSCAKSEFVAWETVGGLEASFRKVLGSLGYTYAALNTSDQPGQHVVSFKATKAGGALAGIWADVDGTTLLGWCSVKVAQAAPARAPAALTPTAPTKAPPPAPAAKPATPAPAAKPAAPAPTMQAPAAKRGYVSGIVLDTQGRPLAGVEVYIYGTTFEQGQRTDFHVQTRADGTYAARVPDGRYRADATLTRAFAGATFELKLHPESGSDKTEVDSTEGGTLNFRWRLTGSRPGGGKDWQNFYGASVNLSYCGLPANAYCDSHYTDIGAAVAPGGSTVTLTFTPQGKLVDGTVGQPMVMTLKASSLRADYPSGQGGGRLVLGQTWAYQSENFNDLPLGVYTLTASATTPDGRKLPLKLGLEQGDVEHGSVTLKWSAYDITHGLKQLRVYIRD